ncbi:MAG: hypothetical protein NPIRA02_30630 [Nitrospirales bacterium]|nr:MAG: hypothetical protein NPIRA02_30630 [Nitrospirales bacterium]
MFLNEIFDHTTVLIVGGVAGSFLTFLSICIYRKFTCPEIVEDPECNETKFDQLKLLFEYTKFHIGLYATLITGLIALMSLGYVDFRPHFRIPIYITVLFFTFAGAAGGVVGSSACMYKDLKAFQNARIGFWGLPMFKGKTWATLEHLFFWIGLANAIGAVIMGENYPLSWKSEDKVWV